MDNTSSIEKAIKESRSYAKRGKKIAFSSIDLLKTTTEDLLIMLNKTIEIIEKRNINGEGVSKTLLEQLDIVKNQFSILPDKLIDDVHSLSDKTINITLFGRTMTGKSTLMEILTHGDGKSIGKGAQRTTRDVREYKYKGIAVTDVPGIAAFGGELDTKIAFEAAKKADLILFLITDDGFQPSEAECLKNVLNLGKPVLCLINIRANIDNKSSLKLFKRDLEKKMNDLRLTSIKQQFLEFGASYGQDWSMLRFEFVHLKAAFLSQKKEWKEISTELYDLSRFNLVEDLIAQEVIKNGGFYKIKSYIDTVVVPITHTADVLIQQSTNTTEQYDIIQEKKEKLKTWLKKFKVTGKKRIGSSLNEIKAQIKKDVPYFSETHYDDKKAGEKWESKLKEYKIEEKCGDILNGLAKECEEQLNDIYREITAELKFNEHVFWENDIKMPSIVDGKRIWNWGVTLVSGGLGIAALFGVPVVGWVALGVGVIGGILSLLFKSKEQKIAEARKKLENRLFDDLDKSFSTLDKKLQRLFIDDLLKKQVDPTFVLIDDILTSMESMFESQKIFSAELYSRQEDINKELLNEALIYGNIESNTSDIKHIARVAGTCLAIVPIKAISKRKILQLSDILRETIYNVPNNDDTVELVANIAGIKKDKIKVNYRMKEINRFVVSDSNLTPDTINRLKLAQQVSKIYITQ